MTATRLKAPGHAATLLSVGGRRARIVPEQTMPSYCSSVKLVTAIGAAVIATTVSAQAAGFPLTLARAHGSGQVAVATRTASIHQQLWLDRIGGVGIARGSATVSCETRSKGGLTGQDSVLTFRVAPGGRQILWRYGGTRDCSVSVVIHGVGRLAVALRGY